MKYLALKLGDILISDYEIRYQVVYKSVHSVPKLYPLYYTKESIKAMWFEKYETIINSGGMYNSDIDKEIEFIDKCELVEVTINF